MQLAVSSIQCVYQFVQNAMMVYDASMPVDLPHQFPPLTLHKVLCHSKAFFLRRLLSFHIFFPRAASDR